MSDPHWYELEPPFARKVTRLKVNEHSMHLYWRNPLGEGWVSMEMTDLPLISNFVREALDRERPDLFVRIETPDDM